MKHVRVLCQCGPNFLLLLKPPGVRHLNVAPLSGCFLFHNPLQPGVQLRVVHRIPQVGSACGGRGSVGGELCRDFIHHFLLLPQESQLPPALRCVRHDGGTAGGLRTEMESDRIGGITTNPKNIFFYQQLCVSVCPCACGHLPVHLETLLIFHCNPIATICCGCTHAQVTGCVSVCHQCVCVGG